MNTMQSWRKQGKAFYAKLAKFCTNNDLCETLLISADELGNLKLWSIFVELSGNIEGNGNKIEYRTTLDKHHLATLDTKGIITIYNIKDVNVISSKKVDINENILIQGLSRSNLYLAITSPDNKIEIWDWRKWKLKYTLEPSCGPINNILEMNSGNLLTVSDTGIANVWDLGGKVALYTVDLKWSISFGLELNPETILLGTICLNIWKYKSKQSIATDYNKRIIYGMRKIRDYLIISQGDKMNPDNYCLELFYTGKGSFEVVNSFRQQLFVRNMIVIANQFIILVGSDQLCFLDAFQLNVLRIINVQFEDLFALMPY